MAEAFANDPVAAFLFPEAQARRAGMERIFAVALRFGLRYGRIDWVPSRGAAIWVSPAHSRPNLWRNINAGFLGIPLAVGWNATQRLLAYERFIEARRMKAMPEPHWYLFCIGVRAQERGRGLGSSLLRQGLERASKERAPCYLETSNPANVPLYRKHGFEVRDSGRIPGGGPEFWGMAATST